jgi:hypothetical protein
LLVLALRNSPGTDDVVLAGMKFELGGLPVGENGLTLPVPYCGWLKIFGRLDGWIIHPEVLACKDRT